MRAGVSTRSFWLGVALATAGVAAFLFARLHAWPPHEDETLALFIGREPLGELLDTVLGRRGGAPLHFLLVHAATAISPTLTAVRLISVVFAVASIPAVAALVARLSDRKTALIATVVVSASWVTLFHGIYGRMYSLFLFTSALSFIALLRALDQRRPSSWALWAVAMLATLASHPYGALVLAVQGAYVVLLSTRRATSLRAPLIAFALVGVLALPLWRSSLVLASRLDVGVGGGGLQLGGPIPVLEYLRSVLGDFVTGWTALFAAVACLAVGGVVVLRRSQPRSALLAVLAFAVPALCLALARVGGSASAPETRHLIFALPFFAMLAAAGLLRATQLAGSRAPAALALSLAALVGTEIAWGWHMTPTLFAGEPSKRQAAREAAEDWLAATTRPTDIVFGYDPLFLGAFERGGQVGKTFVPRADPKLALETLLDAQKPLGRGVWVLDASDGSRIVSNSSQRLEIDDRSPGPGFETRVFGPFLVVRSLGPTGTPLEFLRDTVRVQQLGRALWVGNAEVNFETARVALERLEEQNLEPLDEGVHALNRQLEVL